MRYRFNKVQVLLYFTFLTACSSYVRINLDNLLKEKIQDAVISGKEIIDFKEMAEFDWDSLIILAPYSRLDVLEQKYNVDFRPIYHTGIDHRENISLIVFFNEGKIVKMVMYGRYPGDFAENKSEFVKRDQAKYRVRNTNKKLSGGKDWIVVELIATTHNTP